MHQLADPFAQIFTNRAEADWAFDLLRDVTRRLRVTGPYDPRLAATLSTRGGRPFLHLDFGNWLVLGFRGPGQTLTRVDMALLADRVTWDERFSTLSAERKGGEPEVRSYELPLELVYPLTSHLQQAFEATLDFIADKFAAWKRSSHWKQHNPELVEAFFDPDKRARLFAAGLLEPELRYERHFTPFELELAEEGEGYEVGGPVLSVVEGLEIGDEEMVVNTQTIRNKVLKDELDMDRDMSHFTSKTFELLEKLHDNPTKNFYQAHREDFKSFVEEPFQQLFLEVATRLPGQITSVMETKKHLFGKILKNDFGQGGAWDFYWGAFYPKGSKRTQDAQLLMWIDRERLEFGFYIGEYGTKTRQRFLFNCQQNYETLVTWFEGIFSDYEFTFGHHDDIVIEADGSVRGKLNLTWQEWLKDPNQASFDLSVVYPKNKVLQLTFAQLVAQIVETYTKTFPLVLLAIVDNPLPAIADYLAVTNLSISQSPILRLRSGQVSNLQSPLLPRPAAPQPLYPLSVLIEDTGYDEATLMRWIRAIERKGQAIFYGPPGTGKTFIAEKLAAHLVGGGDGFTELVQFHPAYAYEDFMQGIRPRSEEGQLSYELAAGRFLEFCHRAQGRRDTCVLIIDEINRADLSRVFGELMYLLEYRDHDIPLAGGGQLKIPANVRLIGTMNTADRSIALVDHALRRRFAFLALRPNFDLLRRYHQREQSGFAVEGLINVLTRLNRQIDDPHYQVGITFFLHPNLVTEIEDIWRMEIEPYLEEYFFDQHGKADAFSWAQVGQEIRGA